MELPVACSLDAATLEGRLAEFAAIGRRGLLARDGHVLRFRGEVREKLAAVVEAERRCCPFLDLRLADGADDVVLSIAGPAEAEPLVDELARAFTG